MVPEKTRAAQDETSEEQRSGKTPVRGGRRARRGREQPPRARGRGALGSGEMPDAFVRLFGTASPCLNGLCLHGGLRAGFSTMYAHTQFDLC